MSFYIQYRYSQTGVWSHEYILLQDNFQNNYLCILDHRRKVHFCRLILRRQLRQIGFVCDRRCNSSEMLRKTTRTHVLESRICLDVRSPERVDDVHCVMDYMPMCTSNDVHCVMEYMPMCTRDDVHCVMDYMPMCMR